MGRPVTRPARKKGTPRRHVLVVDREQAICDFVAAVVEEIGVAVSWAADSAAARALLRRRRFGLAFIAVVLPDEDGEALAAHVAARGIPVVLMSGHPAGIERGRASGFAFVAKPFRAKEILRLTLDSLEV